jgi:hypothetical protein
VVSVAYDGDASASSASIVERVNQIRVDAAISFLQCLVECVMEERQCGALLEGGLTPA